MGKKSWMIIGIALLTLFFTILIYLQGEKITMHNIINSPNLHIYVSICFFLVFLCSFLYIANEYRRSLKTIFRLSESKKGLEKFKEDFFKEQKEHDDKFRENILTTVHLMANDVSKLNELAKQVLKII